MWKILGLVLALAIVLTLTIRILRGNSAPEEAPPVQVSQEVAPTPRDVARNSHSAEAHVQRSTCIAACAESDRICRGTAVEPEMTSACSTQLQTCAAACATAH